MKDSFVFYKDWAELLDACPEELKLPLCLAIINYALYDEMPKNKDVAILFVLIKKTIDRNREKWADTKQKRSEAGRKHKGNQYTKKEQNGTNGTNVPSVPNDGTNGTDYVNVNVNDNVNVNVTHSNVCSIDKEKKNKRDFSFCENHEQNMQQAYDWATSKNLPVTKQDVSEWYAYNQQVGWVTKAGTAIKDKKASLRCFLNARKAKQTKPVPIKPTTDIYAKAIKERQADKIKATKSDGKSSIEKYKASLQLAAKGDEATLSRLNITRQQAQAKLQAFKQN